jgi:hypothetical protein
MKGGEKEMLFSPELHGRLALELAEQRHAAADRRRQARQARAHQARRPGPALRQRLGHRLIEFGARLAAEPSLESARSR